MNNLNEHLTRQADQFVPRGGTELDLAQVLDRAGEIRRGRRMRATLVMAACVLAIAVPTIVVAADHGSPDHRAPDRPTPAHGLKTDVSPLQLTGLDQGRPPAGGYAQDSVIHTDGTADVTAKGAVRALVQLGSQFLVETDIGEGDLRVALVPSAGQAQSWQAEGGIAVSDNGDLAAFVQPDGSPVVVSSDGTHRALPAIPRGSGFAAVAVTGSDCTSADAACAVWVNSSGQRPEAWIAPTDGSAASVAPGRRSVDDVLGGTAVAGMTRATDSGSCSAVGPIGAQPAWTTCQHQLGTFSPDGMHLSAFPAYFDGAGSPELAVLDATSGDVVLDLHTAQDAFVGQVVWEDGSHLLAIVGQGSDAAVLRIGLDGSREYAVPPTETAPYESPFVLPSR